MNSSAKRATADGDGKFNIGKMQIRKLETYMRACDFVVHHQEAKAKFTTIRSSRTVDQINAVPQLTI